VTRETRVANEHDFEHLYREQGARLYHALLAYTGDKEISVEAVAEAFVRGIASRVDIRDPVPWIWRVAFRIAGEELRRRKRFGPLEDSEHPPPEPPELFAALNRLSARQRAAVVLHYYAGYSLDEIALILGTKKGTIGVHLHRGRARLKQILEVHDG
jgi:RNA polymerase sigma factor (sigma-70 family)